MLAGQRNTAESMFGNIGSLPRPGPTVDEMEFERKRVMARKHVSVEGHHVRVFNMHVAEDVKAYEKLMPVLIAGIQAMTHAVSARERALVTTAQGTQAWHYFIEWTEYKLNEEATPVTGAQPHQKRTE